MKEIKEKHSRAYCEINGGWIIKWQDGSQSGSAEHIFIKAKQEHCFRQHWQGIR